MDALSEIIRDTVRRSGRAGCFTGYEMALADAVSLVASKTELPPDIRLQLMAELSSLRMAMPADTREPLNIGAL